MKLSTTTTALLITGAIILTLALLGATGYISAYNYGNRAEQTIIAFHTNNKNVLSSYTKKIQEAAQIPAMQRDDLTKVVTAALSARYGSDGSKAMMQFVKEQNPNIDSAVYTKLQQIIESGRDDFKNSQAKLIDATRVYKTHLGSFYEGMWLSTAGYPKIVFSDYAIVTDSRTEATFKTGVEAPIKLR